eukprot:8269597-Pyramimonas_sp.AAC.1
MHTRERRSVVITGAVQAHPEQQRPVPDVRVAGGRSDLHAGRAAGHLHGGGAPALPPQQHG